MSEALSQNPISRGRLTLIAIILILIWGSAFNFVGVAVDHISPLWLTAWRLGVAAVFLTLFALITGQSFPPLTDKRWLVYLGLGISGGVLPFFLLAKGQVHVESGLTAILTGSMPLITIVLAHFFTDEKLTWPKMIGFFIGFVGVIVLFLPDNFSVGVTGQWGPQLLIMGAAFCYAFTTVFAKRAPQTPAAVGSAIMMIAAAAVAITAALILEPGEARPNTIASIMIGLLGVGSTGIATILYLYAIDVAGPSTMARINYFPPVASVIFGVYFLDELFTWKIALAFAIILLGVFVSRARFRRRRLPTMT